MNTYPILNGIDENTKNILLHNAKIDKNTTTFLLHDNQSPLATLLTESYKKALQELKYPAVIIDFDATTEEKIKEKINTLKKNDVVVLIQSNSFRMNAYRLRLELYHRGLRAIEHVRLGVYPENEWQTYGNSLTYHYPAYKKMADALIPKLAACSAVEIITTNSKGQQCSVMYSSPMEEPKQNIGEINEETQGSLFPIGEVFTEPKDLTKINGDVFIYAYPNEHHKTVIADSFKITVKDGCLIRHEGPEEFEQILAMIRTEQADARIQLRELGFGMNPFISKQKSLLDISAHERVKGIHFSLGMKHGVYRKKTNKKDGKKQAQRFHVDIFPNVVEVKIGDEIVFEDEKYTV